MTAHGFVGGDPTKLSLTGGTMTGLLELDDASPAASEQYVADHGGGGGGTAIAVADSGFQVGGNVSVSPDAFTQLGPDLTIAAAAGDHLELVVNAFFDNSSGGFVTVDVATRVSSADLHYASTGTGTPRYPGTFPGWYMTTGVFATTAASVPYVVQAGDIVSGNVLLRVYGRSDSGATRNCFANATFPFRWAAYNLGAGS